MSEDTEMSDDLRTRIAAVLAEAQETHNGISDLALADAVIRELGLRRELRYPNRLPHYTFMPPQRTRYVTGWELR